MQTAADLEREDRGEGVCPRVVLTPHVPGSYLQMPVLERAEVTLDFGEILISIMQCLGIGLRHGEVAHDGVAAIELGVFPEFFLVLDQAPDSIADLS